MRRFGGGFPQSGLAGAFRPDPDDVPLARWDPLSDPGEFISRPVPDWTPEGRRQDGNLEHAVAAASMVDPKGQVPVSPDSFPSVDVDGSESQKRSLPKRPPPLNVSVGPGTRRLRADFPTEVTASLSGQSVLDLEDGGFRSRYALQLLSPAPSQPARTPRPGDLGAAMNNPVEGWPESAILFPTGNPYRPPVTLLPPSSSYRRVCFPTRWFRSGWPGPGALGHICNWSVSRGFPGVPHGGW